MLHADTQVIMISYGSELENQQMVVEYAFDFPVLHWESEIVQAYVVPGTPFLYLIDSTGQIISKGFVNTLEDLERLIVSVQDQE